MISGNKLGFVTFFIDVQGFDVARTFGWLDSVIDIISGTSTDELWLAFLDNGTTSVYKKQGRNVSLGVNLDIK